MPKNKIFIPATIATTAMTLFSYFVSEIRKKNFREPKVLAQLIQRLPNTVSKSNAEIAGWLSHYAIGVVFATFYNKLWKHNIIKPSIKTGILLGAASGIIGVIVWKGVFEIHPKPPRKNLNEYFVHLMFAHLVFGVMSILAYKLSKKDENS